jgi:acetyltransferase-like isoleucine patch superfamily enzyme
MSLRLRMLELLASRLDVLLRHHLSIGPETRRGRRFHRFGERSVVLHPIATIYNEEFIEIGDDTMIGPNVSIAAGMVPGQQCLAKPVVSIGNRCLIGRDSSIVGHLSISIGDDVWTGPRVYITDQNHGYEDIDRPISVQTQPERPVTVGTRSWIGAGAVLLPGATVGMHCTIGANSVVTGVIPDYSVAVGAPARVVKRYESGIGWVTVRPTNR